jgi:hypothetical protein
MRDLLLVNARVLLRFYARDRLLLALALLMLVIFGLTSVPTLLFQTATSRFETLRDLAATMNAFAFVFTPALGLIAISSHLRHRNLKMVVTKPCPPEVWLGAVFVSAGAIALVIHTVIAIATFLLSLAWGLPYQSGFLLLALEGLCESMTVLSVLIMLAVILHPVIAVFAAVFVNESLLYQLKFLAAGAQAGHWRGWLLALQVLLDSVYTLLPLYDPLGERAARLRQTLRPEAGDWLHLLLGAAYTLVATAFFYAISTLALRRKTLA